MDFKTLLRLTGPSDNFNSVKVLLANVKEDVAEAKEEDGIEEEIADGIQAKLDVLEDSIDQMSEYVSKFQETQDRQVLPIIKGQIDDVVKDYKSAYDATMFYTKGWFSRSFLSVEGKVELARYLVQAIKPYCKSNLDTLNMIYQRNPDLILFITWPRDGD